MRNHKEAHLYAFPRRIKFCGSISEWVSSQLCLPCILSSALECAPTNRSGENRGLSQVHPPLLTAASTGSVCGTIHVNESKRKRKYKEGPSPILAIWTLSHSHVPTFNNSDYRSLCKREQKPKRVVFLMLHIDNPHPHKENKFLFI